MVWWPFAPNPERADRLVVTHLHSGAPPLYSTPSWCKLSFGFGSAALRFRGDVSLASNREFRIQYQPHETLH